MTQPSTARLCQVDLRQGIIQLVDATKLKSPEAKGQHVFWYQRRA
jgi:hypothetical protein